MRSAAPAVYVLCFSRPFHRANGRHPGARHYVGIALDGDVERRLAAHLAGHGSPLVRASFACRPPARRPLVGAGTPSRSGGSAMPLPEPRPDLATELAGLRDAL